MSPARPRTGPGELARLVPRLTERDFALIDTLGRFGVMTTGQIGAVFFPSVRLASLRLRALIGLEVVTRARLPRSGVWQYALDWAGQAVHALRTGSRPPNRTDAAWAVHQRFFSPTRAHDSGAVEAIAALHLACRQHGSARITEWLSETEAAAEFSGLRPDAAFTLDTDTGRSLTAWWEHDTGTETLARLAAKITAYQRRRSPLLPYNRKVLIAVPNTARIRALTGLVVDTGDLTVAVGPHPVLPAWRTDPTPAAHLLTEPHWHLLGTRSGRRGLLDLTASISPQTGL
ncbi:replication-relaxation family protein [Glycomyces sp. NPDC046736]|uniref:replication-relaxation family protein n=1 Tax=Glycomyces sp. NPDC046736 TaxID=3155615 RepID=UPI0033FA6E7E